MNVNTIEISEDKKQILAEYKKLLYNANTFL